MGTLGSMSEADLLAAAAAQMDEIPPLPPMIGKPSSAPSSVKSKQAAPPAPPDIRDKPPPAVYDKPPPKYDKPPPIHDTPPPPAAAARDSGAAPVHRDQDSRGPPGPPGGKSGTPWMQGFEPPQPTFPWPANNSRNEGGPPAPS